MKKFLIMLLGAILALFSVSFSARGDEVTLIIIYPHGPDVPVLHRDETSSPIQCNLDQGYLEVTFLSDLGFVSVEIENQTTSEYTQTVVNSAVGLAIFPISGNAGFWSITFSLSDGTVYYGEFVI